MGFAPADETTRGVIGLRMGYLAKHPSVRKDVLSRLQVGEDLFQVASNIHATGPGFHLHINLFADDMDDFGDKLETLLGPGTKDSYETANGNLDPRNQDTPQGRKDFRQYWATHAPAGSDLANAIGAALIAALHLPPATPIDFGWQADLARGDQPDAGPSRDAAGVAHDEHVVFHTDQGPY